jgi:hypothetical protein
MEFRRSYWNESANSELVARHEREIFPLLRRRFLFCGVENFLLYDFFNSNGSVNEDVFAYSNRAGDERALVIYNNKYAEARGWARTSVAFALKRDGTRSLAQKCLGEGLALPNDPYAFVIFRDWRGGLEYIRSCRELWEKGLYAELNAFRCQVFMDFRIVFDDRSNRWSRLAGELGGRGVPNIDWSLREMELRPIRDPFARLLESPFPGDAAEKYEAFLDAIGRFAPGADRKQMTTRFRQRLASVSARRSDKRAHAFLWLWATLRPLCPDEPGECTALSWIDEWMLGDMMRGYLVRSGWQELAADPAPGFLAFLLRTGEEISDVRAWTQLLENPAALRFLDVNEFERVRWFSKERVELFTACLTEIATMEGWEIPKAPPALAAAEASGYRWDDFREILRPKNVNPGRKDPE